MPPVHEQFRLILLCNITVHGTQCSNVTTQSTVLEFSTCVLYISRPSCPAAVSFSPNFTLKLYAGPSPVDRDKYTSITNSISPAIYFSVFGPVLTMQSIQSTIFLLVCSHDRGNENQIETYGTMIRSFPRTSLRRACQIFGHLSTLACQYVNRSSSRLIKPISKYH